MSKSGPVLLLAIFVLVSLGAAPRIPADAVLGVRLGMPKEAAFERLEKLGRVTSGGGEESEGGQNWVVSDPSYANIVVGLDPRERVQWITVYARRGGRGIRFRDVGDLKQARKRGNYIYVWSIPVQGRRAAYQVIARSLNPDTLQSLSLVSLPSKPR